MMSGPLHFFLNIAISSQFNESASSSWLALTLLRLRDG
jgi:hypothetical protein